MRTIVAVALLALIPRVSHGQAPDADIFLVSLSRNGGKLAVTAARNLTNRPGYDNQPNWSADGKAIFFTLAFGIPISFNSVGSVLAYYGVAGLVAGIVLSVVFQAAHCVEEAEFPMPKETGRIGQPWAIHQAETTVNFARRSRVAAWFLGGLNFQIEHHLFPRISHAHYPAISRLVEEVCRDFGVKYAQHATFWAAMASHFRWLRRMGMPTASA